MAHTHTHVSQMKLITTPSLLSNSDFANETATKLISSRSALQNTATSFPTMLALLQFFRPTEVRGEKDSFSNGRDCDNLY